ncbi:MAG: hypothetical protein GVY28_12355 [Alphaproteobacteria bacterium]|nr:hypothetical protein [Alphaproteobacteria bacterium]
MTAADTPAREPDAAAAASDSVVDLARHPVDRLDGPDGRALVDRARRALDAEGCAVLKGFVRPDVLAAMTEETLALSPAAHFNRTHTNPYSSADDPTLPEGDPRRVFLERTNGFVAGDRIGSETMLRRLYHDPAVQAFVAAAMGVDRLHEYADPFAGLVVNVLKPGCQHPWHFDNNDFIVSLCTREPEAGGAFEYCPRLRSAEDENYAAVGAVLAGDRGPVRTLDLRPGDLQIFYGRNSLHRVTRVDGARERHTLILGYTERPGVIAGAERTRRLFGRVAQAHLDADAAGRSVEAGAATARA